MGAECFQEIIQEDSTIIWLYKQNARGTDSIIIFLFLCLRFTKTLMGNITGGSRQQITELSVQAQNHTSIGMTVSGMLDSFERYSINLNYTTTMSTSSKQIWVSPNQGGGWKVKQPDNSKASVITETKAEAVQAAQIIARNQGLETKIQ